MLAARLVNNITALHAGDKLLAAGTGNDPLINHDKLIRSDKIYWLDRIHNDVHENSFFDLMDSFVNYLNSSCYTGITGYEFHYTLYEKGSFINATLINLSRTAPCFLHDHLRLM